MNEKLNLFRIIFLGLAVASASLTVHGQGFGSYPGMVTIDGETRAQAGASVSINGRLYGGAGRPVDVYVAGFFYAHLIADSSGDFAFQAAMPASAKANAKISIIARSNGWTEANGTRRSADSDEHRVIIVPHLATSTITLALPSPSVVKVNQAFTVSGVLTSSNPQEVSPAKRAITLLQGNTVLSDDVMTVSGGRFSATVRLTEGTLEDVGALPLTAYFDGDEFLSSSTAFGQINVIPRSQLELPVFNVSPAVAKAGDTITLSGTATTDGTVKRVIIEFYIKNDLVDRVAVTPSEAGTAWKTRFTLPRATPTGTVAIIARYRGDDDYRRFKDHVRIRVTK